MIKKSFDASAWHAGIECEQEKYLVYFSIERDYDTLFKIFLVFRQRESRNEKDTSTRVRTR